MRPEQHSRPVTRLSAAALAVTLVPVIGVGSASAQDNNQASSDNVSYTKATSDNPVVESPLDDGRVIVSVYSPSMDIEVPNIVQFPANYEDGDGQGADAPVLYLVNGAGGGEDAATWQAQSDVKTFMEDKNAYTVTPIGGAFSYYTDWDHPDPNVQTRFASSTKRMMFETYLAKELPQLFEAKYGDSDSSLPDFDEGDAALPALDEDRGRTLSAISMTATSVLTIAQKHAGVFDGIGSFSGCAETSTPIGYQFINIVTGMRGGANLDNMWGPYPGDGWTDNDPVVNADKFVPQRDDGTLPAMWVTTGNGLPGPHESFDNWRLRNNIPALANQAIVGGIIEAATQYCTANLSRRFDELAIPAQFDFKPHGTHSWGYWQDDLHNSWPMFAEAMDVTPSGT